MPLKTFSCECGWQEDLRVGYDVPFRSCPSCGLPAPAQSVYAVNFGGFARTPAAERDWSRSYREFQEATHETKTVLPTFQQARAVARTLARKGAKDANDVDVRRL